MGYDSFDLAEELLVVQLVLSKLLRKLSAELFVNDHTCVHYVTQPIADPIGFRISFLFFPHHFVLEHSAVCVQVDNSVVVFIVCT